MWHLNAKFQIFYEYEQKTTQSSGLWLEKDKEQTK